MKIFIHARRTLCLGSCSLSSILLLLLISRTGRGSRLRNEDNMKSGEMQDSLRGRVVLNDAETMRLPADVEPWISALEENGDLDLRQFGVEGTIDKENLNPESLWKIWNSLPAATRDVWIRNFYPFLIPKRSRNDGGTWRLHCADAYKLCMADKNCYWKYKNYLASCTADDSMPMETPRKRRRHVESSPRRGSWGTVYKVEKLLKKDVRSLRHRRRRRRAHWMGRLLDASRANWHSDDVYFSMKTRSNKCSHKCVSALMMLNETVYGGLLAHCDCSAKTLDQAYFQDSLNSIKSSVREDEDDLLGHWEEDMCKLHQRTAQSCRPRPFHGTPNVIGCTEARKRCEKDPICYEAQRSFLGNCSQVINGLSCSKSCNESVRKLRKATKYYDTCVCDTGEGPTCRQIRSNVARLCNVPTTDDWRPNDLQPENGPLIDPVRDPENRASSLQPATFVLLYVLQAAANYWIRSGA